MKKVSTITPEQYAALKKHLKLVDRSHFPADDAEIDKLPSHSFPCYFFDPGKLAEKDEDILAVTMLGRRNPWNCAQLIAAMMPQVLNYIPEEPWYKTALKELKKTIRRFARNYRSLFLRIRLAIHHRDEEEILFAIIRLMNESIWGLCWLCVPVCFFAGFFKPHCFITCIFFVILAALWRTMNIDFNNDRRA